MAPKLFGHQFETVQIFSFFLVFYLFFRLEYGCDISVYGGEIIKKFWQESGFLKHFSDQGGVPRDPRFVFRTFYYFRLHFFHHYFF